MMEYSIGPVSQIPSGEGRTFEVAGSRVAVFRMRNGQLFATQANCPHRGGPLADGMTDGITVTCPLHERIYDLRTGDGIGTSCNVIVYPIKASEDGTMMLTMVASQPVLQPA